MHGENITCSCTGEFGRLTRDVMMISDLLGHPMKKRTALTLVLSLDYKPPVSG